jgi:cytochrome c peroxidase
MFFSIDSQSKARGRSSTLKKSALAVALIAVASCLACGGEEKTSAEAAPSEPAHAEAPAEETVDPGLAALMGQASNIFGTLPRSVPNPDNPSSDAKIDLGRMLYYDTRLSKNHDIACNSCHQLDRFGVDGEATSPGHRGQRGDRNSPTVYNAALHVAQFWDGRAPDVEAQAKGPVLNPIEMASASEESVVAMLLTIPGYGPAFAAAFPDDAEPVSYENMARAIGAFERQLTTPGRFDRFLSGEADALSAAEREGLETFITSGCMSCHMGPAVGGTLYRKLGFVFPYETEDVGRESLTGEAGDKHVFKVPSLRNIAETGPYFHDGSIESLPEAVRIMGYHQLGLELDDAQIASIVTFLGSLTGEVDEAYIARPELPESGPNTPAPDPS